MASQLANGPNTFYPPTLDLPPFPGLSVSDGSSATLPLPSFIPPSLRPSYTSSSTAPTSTMPVPPPSAPHRTAPLRIARQKAATQEAMPSFTLPDTAADPLNNLAPSPAPTAQLPNTASTSTSMSGAESSSYLPTPPLSDVTSSPPLTSSRPSLAFDRSPLPRPDSVQFGPRPARNSKRVSSLFLEQQRAVQVASTEEFGVPNASYPVLSLSTDTQSILEEPQPIMRMASPTPSLPNPYTTSLRRTQTASSVASSTFTLGSAEFGPRPRPKLTLTLSTPDSKPSISTTVIAINEADALLPNPFQLQANLQSYFSPHTPAHPPTTATDPPIQTGVTSTLGADLNTGFGVSYFSPHTPAAPGLLSSLGTGNTTTTSTDPVGTRQSRRTEKGPEVRASGLLALPSSAAIGSYWSPHTPVVPEGLEGAIEEAAVEEPEEGSMKETEYLKADHKTRSFTTTIATDGHSVGPSSISHCDPSSPSSNEVCADTDVAASTSDSGSSIGSSVLLPNKPSKPQLRLQTWGLDKMREEKKRQDSTAVRRQGSKDKDARNRERKATKATERTMRKEAEMTTQTTGAAKGGNVPPMLRPRGDQVALTPRPPRLAIGSNSIPDGQEKSERPSIPATLRPGSLFQAVPPPAQLALRSRPVLNILESPATQGTDTIAIRNSTATNAVWDLTLDARPQLDLTLTNPYLPPHANSNTSRDWYTRGRTPSEPNVPTARVLGVGAGGAQGQELERNSMPRERRRFGFFGNAGAAASDTNLAGVAASSRPAPVQRKSKDDKEASELKENRKNAFYSRGINASLEALAGWGGKVFSHSSTTVNTHGHGQLSRKGEKDEHPTVPYPQHHVPSQIRRLPTPPLTDTQRQYTPPRNPSPPNMRVYQAPLYPPGDRGPSFEDFGVEIGWAGRNKTHTPPLVADEQQFKKGHTKNSSSGLSGFRKMFGFGKKEKEKGKQKWI